MEHELKTWPQFFSEVRAKRKQFELRKDDRAYKPGDMLLLREWDPQTQEYTGQYERAEVTYIYRGPFVAEGFCCMSIKLHRDW